MSFHIKALSLTGTAFERYRFVANGLRLRTLSKVNLFVGANNSGKSRFLRALASIEKLDFVPQKNYKRVTEIVHLIQDSLQQACKSYNADDANSFVLTANQLSSMEALQEDVELFDPLKSLLNETIKDGDLVTRKGNNSEQGSHARLRQTFQRLMTPLSEEIDAIAQSLPQKYTFKRVYIPTLRGLRRFGNSGDIYEQRTRIDYFKDAKHVEIFTGLALYDELRKLLLGTYRERQSVAAFEQFLSEAFFESNTVTLIPKHDQDVIDVKIGDEPQLPIFNLGDGIQSIIILTFPLFRDRGENLLLFIEEPELFLHPGLQRIFLNVLRREEFANAQYFLSTHSNHLLDLTLDVESISVFNFHKRLDEEQSFERSSWITVENVSNEDERSLQLLGIQNSSVFLANCTIWVEGITDRRYFAHYLNLYQDHIVDVARKSGHSLPVRYKQDLHYSFVEYAGANITHYSFLDTHPDAIVVERLCGKLFLIADRDDENNLAKQKRHQRLAEKLNDCFYRLECREVENLLTPTIIKAVVAKIERGKVEFNRFTQSGYKSYLLGRFIENKAIKGERSRTYQSKTGSLEDKITFCQHALEYIQKFNDLSSEAQEITRKIYSFISSRNP